MRRLTILVAVLALIYSAYWFIGATAAERGARQVLDNLRNDGWQVSYDDVSTRGFPSRFDTTFTALDLQAPEGGFGISTPFVQALALSYQPNKIIAVFPERQTIRFGQQDIAVQSDGLRANAAFAANTALSLNTVTAEVGPATLTSNAGWSLALDRAIWALREDGPTPNTYDMYLDADALVLPDWLRSVLNPMGIHPDAIGNMTLDLTVTLDRPLDRHALSEIEFVSPHVMHFTLNMLTLQWGNMTLTGGGDLAVGPDGIPMGTITLKAVDWREMIRLAANAGLIQPGFEGTIEGFAATLAGGQQTLELPIAFQNGQMSIGPLPIGPAPRFH